MNIFRTSESPELSARVLADQHVIKMTTETAQILSTAARRLGLTESFLYRSTHRTHPCVLWTASSRNSAQWACLHGLALSREYNHRFGRTHASGLILEQISQILQSFPEAPEEDPPKCVFPEHVSLPLHEAYRETLIAKYLSWTSLGRAPRWTNRDPPLWWLQRRN